MWNSEANLDKYLYVRTNPHVIRALGLMGLLATLLMAYGFWKFFNLTPLYLVIFGTIAFFLIINKSIRYFMQMFYPKFDIGKHEQFVDNYWANNPEPKVDVFLPWAGEDLEVHEQVVKAVKQLRYKNFEVYMLDDAGREDHKKLAEKYGFNYLSRPNKGVYKKSGNLQYGYEHSSGKYIFILDADFIPTKDSLRDLIPYIDTEPEVGILQTPQYLEQTSQVHKRSKIEYGGGNIVEEFYKINMPCRDVFKAAMCVGTSAVYRRDAILTLDGTPKVHASEDLATGLLITQYGYYVKYLPLICSIGTSPETFQGYFKQHQRWCSGNIVFAKYWPQAKLSVMGRLIYLSNPTYYLSEALSVIFSFHYLLLLFFHTESLALINMLYFLPYVIFSRVIIPLSKTQPNKTGTKFAALSNSYTYIYTYLHLLIKGLPAWHPTGIKIKSLHPDFLNAINIGIVISSVYILGFIGILFAKPSILGNYNTYIILGWGIYSVAWHVLFLYAVSRFITKNRLPEMTNLPAKAYLYAKSHLSMVLLIVLCGAVVLNMTKAMQDPNALTVLAINNITNPQAPQIAQGDTNNVQILGSQDQDIEYPKVAEDVNFNKAYIYKVEKGDSLIVIARKAIVDYKIDKRIDLTTNQENQSAINLIKSSENLKAIHPGDEIIFEGSLIKNVIADIQLTFK